MSRPFINVTRVDLRGVERELARIATALELAMGIHASGPEPEADPANPAVAYSTEEDLIRAEWEKLRGVPVEETEP